MSVSILTGDCRETLKTIACGSVQCCVTSPPYFGLRDYGHAQQIGREKTTDEYVAELADVFREVRRVLRADGTLWLNIGDTFGPGKQLLLLPARVALALQADGWILRQQIVWAKPSPMPEQVKDRPSSAWEPVFLLAKSKAYFYDQDAIREPAVTTPQQAKTKWKGRREFRDKGQQTGVYHGGGKPFNSDPNPLGRNARNVWAIPPTYYKGAHDAIMPTALAERCIKAGTRPGDMVLDPFGGSGTTAIAATKLGRDTILCELNEDHARTAETRIGAECGLLATATYGYQAAAE